MDTRDTYSTYEAKARFSELLRKVRDGRVITVTYHGEPIAEIRPVAGGSGTAARIARLRERGLLTDAGERKARLEPVARRRGALQRFLEERDL
jgi:prevent-host-death family protein